MAGLVAFGELFRHLPPDRAVALGARVGGAYARLHGPRTREVALNLRLAFPECSEAERQRLHRASFQNLGRCIAEVFVLQGRHRETLLSGLSIEGLEHYEAARKASASEGVIVVTAHFGSWELCGAAMAQRGYPLSVVHHEIANPGLEEMVGSWRRGAGVHEIRLGKAAAGVLRALARGRIVALLLDQNSSREEGVFAPFFGVEASTRSGPVRIAQVRGVPLLPVFVFRQGTSARHVVRVFPVLELEAKPDDEITDEAFLRDVARLNGAIEQAIRAAPDHWLWAHRRWKTRPEGQPALYPRRRRRLRT